MLPKMAYSTNSNVRRLTIRFTIVIKRMGVNGFGESDLAGVGLTLSLT